MVELEKERVPELFSMPPPLNSEELPEMVELVTVKFPLLTIAPPRAADLLLERVELEMVVVPPFATAPPWLALLSESVEFAMLRVPPP